MTNEYFDAFIYAFDVHKRNLENSNTVIVHLDSQFSTCGVDFCKFWFFPLRYRQVYLRKS